MRTIVASLIATNGPSAVNIITVEPSAGASFGAFAGLGHMVGTVDRFDEHGGVRLLRALQSEVNRRSRLLSDNHVVSLADYQLIERRVPESPTKGQQADNYLDDAPPTIARLVIFVDDADDVMMRQAAFLPQLIDLADRSRHLGIHLIVAAEQLSRSIEHLLKSFANIRIALRMNDPADAVALVGSRDPVQISLHTPGRGMLRVGESPALAVQFASAAAESSDLMEITPFILARDLNAAERKISARPAIHSAETQRAAGLRHLIGLVGEAASTLAPSERRPILCPDLPTDLPYDRISSPRASTPDAAGAAFALSDLPDDHTQNARRWNPSHDGNLLIIGGGSAERSNALATMFIAATDRVPPDRLHGYVIDCAAGQLTKLSALELLPACGAVASTEDPDRILRVLERLVDEMERRAASDTTATEAHIVLAVNDVGALLRTLEIGGEFEHGSRHAGTRRQQRSAARHHDRDEHCQRDRRTSTNARPVSTANHPATRRSQHVPVARRRHRPNP